jgi:hypothetical protein
VEHETRLLPPNVGNVEKRIFAGREGNPPASNSQLKYYLSFFCVGGSLRLCNKALVATPSIIKFMIPLKKSPFKILNIRKTTRTPIRIINTIVLFMKTYMASLLFMP